MFPMKGTKFYNELEDLSQDPLILCLQPQGVLPEPQKKRRPRAGPPALFLGPGLGPWPLALALDHHGHHDQDDDDYVVTT